ncbi:hypothetical protein J8273_2336 [Carpediemonas membranifera]|uniref:Uncharacterized protein n=1 Tax=Carpediemonas membranifera TaxID=201153 RepID=A0A8J6BA94_9EUKA|nr:hypothetical protein J8273_2336 [Carpediemonas membranifera]|eukprot:KAG9395987.1 hypothetical protein J8273_2336 [Carpediemonas membranifera]
MQPLRDENPDFSALVQIVKRITAETGGNGAPASTVAEQYRAFPTYRSDLARVGIASFIGYLKLADKHHAIILNNPDSPTWVSLPGMSPPAQHPTPKTQAPSVTPKLSRTPAVSPPSDAVDPMFAPLIQAMRQVEIKRPDVKTYVPRVLLGAAVRRESPDFLAKAKVSNFKDYIAKAEARGVIETGGEAPANLWVKVKNPTETPSRPGRPWAQDDATPRSAKPEATLPDMTPDQLNSVNDTRHVIRRMITQEDCLVMANRVRRSALASKLYEHTSKSALFAPFNITNFPDYINILRRYNIIHIGGVGGDQWVSLVPGREPTAVRDEPTPVPAHSRGQPEAERRPGLGKSESLNKSKWSQTAKKPSQISYGVLISTMLDLTLSNRRARHTLDEAIDALAHRFLPDNAGDAADYLVDGLRHGIINVSGQSGDRTVSLCGADKLEELFE